MTKKANTIVQQHIANFETLKRAFKHNQVALMECKVAATGELVAALCAVGHDERGEFVFTPFCLFMNGNPYEILLPPDPDRPGKFMGEE